MGLELAQRACELSGWADATCLGTLAQAHAEAGQWADAVRHGEAALEAAGADEADECRRRLEDYRCRRS